MSTGRHPGGLFQSAPDNVCFADNDLKPGADLPAAIPSYHLVPTVICYPDFPADSTKTVVLTGPDGSTRRYQTVALVFGIVFTIEMPLGTWTVQVTAPGVDPAGATITVARATSPTVYETAERGSMGGAGTTVEMAGFPPSTHVNVFLYGPGQKLGLRFIRPLPTAVINGNGESRYSVNALRADPPGLYGIWMNPRCESDDVACVQYQK